ncbi:MAG: toxin-antitoxin system TumE family protein [Promethearchaeota archaeon]
MSARLKIDLAKEYIEQNFSGNYSKIQIDYEDPRIKVNFEDGSIVYIQYNNHNQYSYHFLFSKGILDRCRFDNYDDKWDVPSKPHHFHPRLSKNAIFSPMNGDVNHDIPELFRFILSGELFETNCRFADQQQF